MDIFLNVRKVSNMSKNILKVSTNMSDNTFFFVKYQKGTKRYKKCPKSVGHVGKCPKTENDVPILKSNRMFRKSPIGGATRQF
jgi:hypothetical protein